MTKFQKGDQVCLKMVVSDDIHSNVRAIEYGVGVVTEVDLLWLFDGGLVSVVFPNGSELRCRPYMLELESEKLQREQEAGAARLERFQKKYNRTAA